MKALFDAVRGERLQEVTLLLKDGADPNSTEKGTHYQDTALTLACKQGNVEIVRELLSKGANPNRREGDSLSERTPLIIAAASGRPDIVEALLRAGANPEARAGLLHAQEGGDDVGASRALTYAAAGGHTEAVLLLVFAGARIERVDLETAITAGHADVVRVLLRAGANPRWSFRDGRTALQTAETSPERSRVAVVELVRRFLAPPPSHPQVP